MEDIYIERNATDVPFGFKLAGGADFSSQLHILSINQASLADRAGLRPGDVIVKINGVDTDWMEHARAKQELIRAGNSFKLTVIRNGISTEKPTLTPLAQLKSNPPQSKEFYTVPPSPPKTSLKVDKQVNTNSLVSQNRIINKLT